MDLPLYSEPMHAKWHETPLAISCCSSHVFTPLWYVHMVHANDFNIGNFTFFFSPKIKFTIMTDVSMMKIDLISIIFHMPFSSSFTFIGRKLQKFTQLKRNKRFDSFNYVGMGPRSPFHIAAGSHPYRKPGGHKMQLDQRPISGFF